MHDSHIERPLGIKIIYWITVIGFAIDCIGVGIQLFHGNLFSSQNTVYDMFAGSLIGILNLAGAVYLYKLKRIGFYLLALSFFISVINYLIYYFLHKVSVSDWIYAFIALILVGGTIVFYSFHQLRKGVLK
jgi:hypothetical protein